MFLTYSMLPIMWALVDNLDPYYEFVDCARQNVTAGKMEASDGSGPTLRLLGKAKAWVVNGVFDPYERDMFGPVFHHGVKPPFDNAKAQLYGLDAPVEREQSSSTSPLSEPFDLTTASSAGEKGCSGFGFVIMFIDFFFIWFCVQLS